MAAINLQPTQIKYVDYTTSNRNFMQMISKHSKEKQKIDIVETRNMTRRVANKLKSLSSTQIDQWIQIQQLKIRQLWRNFPDKGNPISISKQTNLQKYAQSLRQTLHIFIGVTKQLNLEYRNEVIADIIQNFYYFEFKDEVLKEMIEAGYKTHKFQVLEYEQKSFNIFCCCLEGR